MMPYSIDVLTHTQTPVLASAWSAAFEFKRDVRAYSDQVKGILDARTDPLYYLMDFREWKDISIDNVMMAAELAARSGNSNFHHPMVKGVLFITGSHMLELTAKGMKSDIYGNLDIRVFSTVEDALAFVNQPA